MSGERRSICSLIGKTDDIMTYPASMIAYGININVIILRKENISLLELARKPDMTRNPDI